MEKIVIDFPDMAQVKKEISELKEIFKGSNQRFSEFSPAEKIAQEFNMTTRTLSTYADKGKFTKYYFGDRNVFYNLSELESFIENSANQNKTSSHE